MVVQSKSEGVGFRFGAYVTELRDFFSSREISFGSPGDLVPFAARVEQPGPFEDEMGSMVRSILFQENGALGRGELLELVTTAVAGPALEQGSKDVAAAVQQISDFLNEALRQQSGMLSPELQVDDEELTAGDVLAAAAAPERTGGRTVAGRSPQNGPYGRGPDPLDHVASAREEQSTLRAEAVRNGMLFRAVSMSETEEADLSLRQWEGRKRSWLIPAVLAGVIALLMGGYLARPLLDHSGSRATMPSAAEPRTALAPGSCAGSPAAGIVQSSLAQRSMWAHRLLDQRLYAAALPELKAIAQADPGFPGVFLDESDALLHLKRPEDAREAVDTQIGISECVAELPSPALDNYCAAEFSIAASATCRPELARIREAAQLQAAMVHLELGHRFEADAGAAAAEVTRGEAPALRQKSAGVSSAAAVRPRRVAPLPPASEGDNAVPAQSSIVSAKPSSVSKTNRRMSGEVR